ncbi:MAG: TolC family protein [Deltaproteobacteria bacterium]|nr:TolC family protein [Deltaproteobacteria bacterium]MBW2121069.1 TolC family protein [Deltaproteobacteria bacterium]
MRKTLLSLALALILCHPPLVHGGRESSKPRKVELTLRKAILLALSNNIDIKIERLRPQVAQTDVEAQESVFDPAVTADVSQSASRRQTDVAVFLTGSAEPFQNSVNIGAGIGKKLSTGAKAELRFGNDRLNSNSFLQRFNPSWDNELSLSVAQPLLRDFGREFNLAPIKIAKNNKHISDIQFRKRVIDIVTEVKEAYWDLVRAIELLRVSKQSVQLARDLLEINKAKVAVGQLAPIDMIEAEAGVAAREEAVILAEDRIGDAEDRLKSLLNPNGGLPLLSLSVTPVDRPKETAVRLSLAREIETALKNRPDYLQAKTELENRLVTVKLAKNQILPRVDVVATAGVSGLAGTYQEAIDEMDGDFYDLRIGLRFEYPLGNRAARSRLLRRELEQQEVELRLENLRKDIALQVREAIRQVETDFKRIKTTRVARRLAEKKLEAQQAKHDVGIATTKDVLDFQVDLAFAQSRELEAIIDYNKSLDRFYQLLGTTLKVNGIRAEMLERD